MRKILRTLFMFSLVVCCFASCADDDNYNDRNGDKAVIPPKGTAVKVMTYNIYGARATDPSNAADLDALAEVIKKQNPDFVLMQEVDAYTSRSGKGVHQAKDLAEKLGMQWHFARAIDRLGGEYGDAVLSKLPIIETKSYRMTPTPELPGEDRSVCVIKVNVEGRDLWVVSTHLDHLGDEVNRVSQAEQLRTIISELGGDIIMGGDFNCVPSSKPMDIISGYMTLGVRAGGAYTFPSDAPDRTIDYIMYTPVADFSVRSYEVVPQADQQVNGVFASDHCPVVATIQVRAGEGKTANTAAADSTAAE